MIEFQIHFDAPFLIEAFAKYRRQKMSPALGIAVKIVCSLMLLGFAYHSTSNREWILTAFFIIVLVCLVFSNHLTKWQIKRQFEKSPFKEEDVVTTLGAEGFHAKGTKSDTKLVWSAFTKARRFDDGFLLFQGPQVFNWLPEANLSKGTAAEAETLIQSHISDYKKVSK